MKIWILGSKGLLGRTLVEKCLRKGIDFVETGREIDLVDYPLIDQFAVAEKPTHAINCAAYTDVDRAETESERAFAVNARGPQHLGQIGRKRGFRLIHLSTDYVFDGSKASPYKEQDLCAPLNVYGKSKRAGEQRLIEEHPYACIVRTSWLFGEGGKNFLSKLIPLLQTNSRLAVDNSQINRPTSADDLAETLFALLDASGIWHVANRGEASRFEIAKYFLEASKRKGFDLQCEEIISSIVTAGAPRPLFSALDTEKVERAVGPLRHWQEILG